MERIFIDFKNFKVYTDITHTKTADQDVRKDFADAMYKNLNGVMAHDVALRIYHSEGPVEFNEDELDLVVKFSKTMTPIFQDCLDSNIVRESENLPQDEAEGQ